MGILVFTIVIVALIVVHELGHFIVAKLSGMRVDEFGLGYPPRAATVGHMGETAITLNWLPFGGFVKIYGENATETDLPDPRALRAPAPHPSGPRSCRWRRDESPLRLRTHHGRLGRWHAARACAGGSLSGDRRGACRLGCPAWLSGRARRLQYWRHDSLRTRDGGGA